MVRMGGWYEEAADHQRARCQGSNEVTPFCVGDFLLCLQRAPCLMVHASMVTLLRDAATADSDSGYDTNASQSACAWLR